MFEIKKEFHFSASHCLESLGEEHPCSRMHGHNYVVEIILQNPTLDQHGMVLDYRELDEFKKELIDPLDHQHLNDLLNFEPTAENLAIYLFSQARALLPDIRPLIYAVRVSETAKTSAMYWNRRG